MVITYELLLHAQQRALNDGHVPESLHVTHDTISQLKRGVKLVKFDTTSDGLGVTQINGLDVRESDTNEIVCEDGTTYELRAG